MVMIRCSDCSWLFHHRLVAVCPRSQGPPGGAWFEGRMNFPPPKANFGAKIRILSGGFERSDGLRLRRKLIFLRNGALKENASQLYLLGERKPQNPPRAFRFFYLLYASTWGDTLDRRALSCDSSPAAAAAFSSGPRGGAGICSGGLNATSQEFPFQLFS